MTVSTQVSRNEYTGNGATTQYDFTFRILDKSHLLVQTLDDAENITTLTLGSNYSVTGVNRYNGGKVVLTSALPAGYKISIERKTPVTQETSIRNQGGFFPEMHEDAFDKLTMLVQQAYGWWSGLSLRKPSWLANYYDALNNRIRNLRDPSQAQDAATKGYADNLYQDAISHSDSNFKRTLRSPDPEIEMLPGVAGRKNKILAFNDQGNPISVLPESGSAADVMIELASYEDGKGDALLAVKQPFPGSVLRTQHDKNAELLSLMDAGGDRNSFDPETLELLVKAVANQLRIPYLGAQQFALPNQTLKVWKYMDGFKDRGAVASFSSIDTPDSDEPTTQVLGLADASALGKYGDRDTVVLFAQAEGQPPLLATSNTTFTATTVTSPDFAAVADKLRRKQIIDVVDASTPSKIYSGWIVAFDPDTNTITIETAWYLKGGNGITTGTPSSGSSLKLVPNTKIWGQNTNVILKPTSDARDFAGFELGLYNNKTNSPVGYGYDAYSGGTYTVLNGFQARGKLYCGFRNYAQGDYGYIGGGHQYGYYDSGSERGLFAWNNTYGVNIKSPTSYAIILQDSSNVFITGMDKDGKWQGLKYYTTTVSPGGSISQYSTVAFVTPTAASQTVTLPAHSAGKVIYVRNLSSSYSISCVGAMEGASGAIALAAKTTIQLVSDGTYWYPISKYVP